MEMLDSRPASGGAQGDVAGSGGDRGEPFLPDYPEDLS
jgi:hypothetical protein